MALVHSFACGVCTVQPTSTSKPTKVVIVSSGTFPIELCLMYECRPLLGTGAKYRKLSFMLSDAILSGHGWFMSLSGAIGVYQKFKTVWHLQKGWFKQVLELRVWNCFPQVFKGMKGVIW